MHPLERRFVVQASHEEAFEDWEGVAKARLQGKSSGVETYRRRCLQKKSAGRGAKVKSENKKLKVKFVFKCTKRLIGNVEM